LAAHANASMLALPRFAGLACARIVGVVISSWPFAALRGVIIAFEIPTMNESPSQFLPSKGAGHPHRYRELLQRLLHFANQGFTRMEFLRLTSGFLQEYSSCDSVEIRIEGGDKSIQCKSIQSEDGYRIECRAPFNVKGPLFEPGGGQILEWITEEILHGRVAAAPPFTTRSGSFWTDDSTRPVVLWTGTGAQSQPKSAVIGGEYPSLAVLAIPVDEVSKGVLILGSHRQDFFVKDDIHFYEAAAEAVGVAIAFHASQWALRERVKELTCLYGIAKIAHQPDLGIEDRLREIAGLLPPGWQYPEITSACISIDGNAYGTPDFEPTPYSQSAPVLVHGNQRGSVIVAYMKEMPEFDEGPFLKEERSLIEEVARQVGFLIEHLEAEEEKLRLRELLKRSDGAK
jgi:hypothetical protein